MIYSVSEINHLAARLFLTHPIFSQVEVHGEISGGKLYPSGHFYFTLKDEQAAIQAVMFRSAYQRLNFVPKDGDKVTLKGNISIYEKSGKYQLITQEMKMQGIGDLYAQFELLKNNLQKQGYFSQEHKKKIPVLPKRIGVATSEAGAVIQDILHVLRRRFPGFKMDFISVAVQGENAAGQIADAIKQFNRMHRVDVIIIARGGGSLEDLWAFNERIVADAIFTSQIPIISGVGHETDYTIADFVADLRAPTPSAAAELVLPEKSSLLEQIYAQRMYSLQLLNKQLQQAKTVLKHFKDRSALRNPQRVLQNHAQYLDELKNRMSREMFYQREMSQKILALQQEKLSQMMQQKLRDTKQQLLLKNSQLRALNPFSVLDRGYTYITDENGQIIKSSKDTKPQNTVQLYWKDGTATAEIKTLKHKNIEEI